MKKKTMLKVTLRALKASIKKWERILNNNGIDERGANCPLCQRFEGYYEDHKDRCPCDTGNTIDECNECKKTPWNDWYSHHRRIHPKCDPFNLTIECHHCRKMAERELNYLKSLLTTDPTQQ